MKNRFLFQAVICLWWTAGLLAGCLPAPTARPEVVTPSPLPAGPTQRVPGPTRPTPAQPSQTPVVRSTATPTPKGSSLQIGSENLQGEEVVFWYAAAGEAEKVMQLLVGEFNQTNAWGVRVRAEAYPGPGVLDEAVLQGVTNQSLPDVLAGYIDVAQRWQNTGVSLLELAPYIEDSAWGLTTEEQQDFFPAFWQQGLAPRRQIGSSLPAATRLGVPWYRSGLVVYYNRTWAGELGFSSPPDTPDEFRQQTCAAAQANSSDRERANDGTGGWFFTDEPLTLLGWIYAFGGSVVDDASQSYRFASPQAEDALLFLQALAAEGCAWSAEETNPAQAFAERQALMWIGSLSALTEQQLALQQLPNDDKWEILPFPSATQYPVIVAYGPELVVVESTESRQLAAWLFVRWLVSPLTQAQWAEAGQYFPVRQSALEQQLPASSGLQQWRQALEWLPYARPEPAFASWGRLRWVLVDAQAQLFSSDFLPANAANLLAVIDQLAAEVHALPR